MQPAGSVLGLRQEPDVVPTSSTPTQAAPLPPPGSRRPFQHQDPRQLSDRPLGRGDRGPATRRGSSALSMPAVAHMRIPGRAAQAPARTPQVLPRISCDSYAQHCHLEALAPEAQGRPRPRLTVHPCPPTPRPAEQAHRAECREVPVSLPQPRPYTATTPRCPRQP